MASFFEGIPLRIWRAVSSTDPRVALPGMEAFSAKISDERWTLLSASARAMRGTVLT